VFAYLDLFSKVVPAIVFLEAKSARLGSFWAARFVCEFSAMRGIFFQLQLFILLLRAQFSTAAKRGRKKLRG